MILFDDSDKFVSGWLGDGLKSISEAVTQGFLNGFSKIIEYIFCAGYWFCKIGVLLCVLLYICSHDQKAVTTGFKLGFIYLIIAIIGSAI